MGAILIFLLNRRLLQNSRPRRKSSFRAREARPGIQVSQAILDSRFRGNDGTGDFSKGLREDSISNFFLKKRSTFGLLGEIFDSYSATNRGHHRRGDRPVAPTCSIAIIILKGGFAYVGKKIFRRLGIMRIIPGADHSNSGGYCLSSGYDQNRGGATA